MADGAPIDGSGCVPTVPGALERTAIARGQCPKRSVENQISAAPKDGASPCRSVPNGAYAEPAGHTSPGGIRGRTVVDHFGAIPLTDYSGFVADGDCPFEQAEVPETAGT